MYIVDNIAYADDFNTENLKIIEIKIVSELYMLITFSNGEKKIFDATFLLQFPAYKKLENFEVFKNAYIENGILMWDNGQIDISTDTLYNNSYKYEQDIA